jgi:GDP-4-dehydro-6-deoxy-D-mannose reductase
MITGINGFVARHLADHCLARGAEVYGTYRQHSDQGLLDRQRPEIVLEEMELNDAGSVRRALSLARPDWLFHLAGWSFVRGSVTAPGETLATNVMGQQNVLEALREADLPASRVLIVGSCEEYGLVREEELPIGEDNPLRPVTPYAVSKIAQDFMGAQYHAAYGMHAVRVRTFHLAGPLSSDLYVISSFARQIAEIEAGLSDPVMKVGNLDVVRDFTDVRDAVRAYWLALEMGEPGAVYNLGSGRPLSIKSVLESLLSHSKTSITTQVDPARLRAADSPVIYCDVSRFTERTGWRPEIGIDATTRDTLDYWRKRVGSDTAT